VNMPQPPDNNYSPAPPQPQPVAVSLPASTPRVTYTILGVTVIAYLLQLLAQFIFGYDLAVGLGAKANEAIRAGQLWRFFTPMLLHGSILHIGFNMYALNAFGAGLERRYGHGRFLLLYILLPHGASTWHEILPGAIGAGLLWELAKKAFLSFVSTYISVSNLVYGSVAAIIAFLAWAYLSGLIFLFGAYLSVSYFQLKQQSKETVGKIHT